MRSVIAFLAALACLVLVGIAALSWFDQQSFLSTDPALTLTFAQRIEWWLRNLRQASILYAPIFGVGLAIAFACAALLAGRAPGLRTWLYGGAGAVAVVAAILIMKAVFGILPLPGARTTAGIAAQGAAGLLAGLVFAALAPKGRRRRG